MDRVLNKRRQPADKTLLGLISQSQRSNHDLMDYLDKAGIRLTDEDWQMLADGRGESRLDETRLSGSRQVHPKAFTGETRNYRRPADLSYRLNQTLGDAKSVEGHLSRLKDANSSDILLHEDWSLVDTDADLSQKAEAIENQLDKLDAFESSHLDSKH